MAACIYILPECIAGIKQKQLKKMPRKMPKDIKLYKNKENNLHFYACHLTNVNFLFLKISDCDAFWSNVHTPLFSLWSIGFWNSIFIYSMSEWMPLFVVEVYWLEKLCGHDEKLYHFACMVCRHYWWIWQRYKLYYRNCMYIQYFVWFSFCVMRKYAFFHWLLSEQNDWHYLSLWQNIHRQVCVWDALILYIDLYVISKLLCRVERGLVCTAFMVSYIYGVFWWKASKVLIQYIPIDISTLLWPLNHGGS